MTATVPIGRVTACVLVACIHVQTAFGVTIVNLGSTTIYAAGLRYHRGYASIPAGDYRLPASQPPHWRVSGWYRAGPGEAIRLGADWVYVEYAGGNRVSWHGLEETTYLVNPAGKFDERVVIGSEDDALRDLRNRGFTSVTFQKMKDQIYWVNAAAGSRNAYRLSQEQFQYDFGSRDPQEHRRVFRVPGKIVDYSINGEQLNANGRWSMSGNALTLVAFTEGFQHRLGAARTRGVYRGTVTIHYTTRN